MTRTLTLALALCALIAAALPGAAAASRTQSMTFEAPVDLADPATRTRDLGGHADTDTATRAVLDALG